MRRIVSVLAVMAVAVAMAMPAFAASPNAVCTGQIASVFDQPDPGKGGEVVSFVAREAGGVGHLSSSNCFVER